MSVIQMHASSYTNIKPGHALWLYVGPPKTMEGTTILPSRRRRVDDTRQISGQPLDYFVLNESLMIRSREKVAWNSGWIHFKKTFEKLKWQIVHITTRYNTCSLTIVNVNIKYTIQQNISQWWGCLFVKTFSALFIFICLPYQLLIYRWELKFRWN